MANPPFPELVHANNYVACLELLAEGNFNDAKSLFLELPPPYQSGLVETLGDLGCTELAFYLGMHIRDTFRALGSIRDVSGYFNLSRLAMLEEKIRRG